MIEYCAEEGRDSATTSELGQAKMTMMVMMARGRMRRREEEEKDKEEREAAHEMLLATRLTQLMGPTERKKRGCALPGGNRKKKGGPGGAKGATDNEEEGGIIDIAGPSAGEAGADSRYPECSSRQEPESGEVADDSLVSTPPPPHCLAVFFLVLFLLAGPPPRAQLTNPQAIDGDNAPLATTTTTGIISSTTAFVGSSSSSFSSLWYPYYCRLATLASSVALQLPIQHNHQHSNFFQLVPLSDMNLVEQQHNGNSNNRVSMMHKSRSFSSFSTHHCHSHQLEEDDADPTGVYSPLKLEREGGIVRTVSFVAKKSVESEVSTMPLCNNCDKCRPKTRAEGFIRSFLMEKLPFASHHHTDALCAPILS